MANQRSPNCPQITFEEAAAKGRQVYEKEHTHPAHKLVVAESLGYSGINGRSLSMIGALRQYGVLEGTGEALRITDDAVAYFELEDGPERRAAISRMLFHPPFFQQMREDFPDQLPSEANLKHYLIKHGFLQEAAANVLKVYRENIRLVEDTAKRYTGAKASEVASMPVSSSALAMPAPAIRPPLPDIPIPQDIPYWSQSFALSKGSRAELTIKGDVTQADLQRLKTYIELTIEALSGDVEPDRATSKGLSSTDEGG
jgi:hypothetical protein